MQTDSPPAEVGLCAGFGLVERLRQKAEEDATDGAWFGCYLLDAAAEIERLRAERTFDSLGMVLMAGKNALPARPGQPHRWADAIAAWARGALVQWRYASPDATDADWRDCNYCSTGEPNWWYATLEYRVKPNVRAKRAARRRSA